MQQIVCRWLAIRLVYVEQPTAGRCAWSPRFTHRGVYASGCWSCDRGNSPGEPTATLRSGAVGSAARGASAPMHRGRRGAGAYCGGSCTACWIRHHSWVMHGVWRSDPMEFWILNLIAIKRNACPAWRSHIKITQCTSICTKSQIVRSEEKHSKYLQR